MSDQPMIEIWGAGTMRTLRPLWVLEELGLAYQLAPIGPRTGETQTEEYTELNPKQKIPFLKDGSVKLSESVAMSRYLIERYGDEESLSIPATIEARAKEDEWVCYVYGELDETSLYVMRRHQDLHTIYGVAENAVDSAKTYAEKHLAVVDGFVSDKEFLLENRLGLADILLVSCLDWAKAYGFDLSPNLKRYRDRLIARPAYQRAHERNYGNR